MAQRIAIVVAFALCIGSSSSAQISVQGKKEPFGTKSPHTRELHGDTFVDDYFWYRYKQDPKVIAHLNAENKYADELMRPTASLQRTLYREFVGRVKETDMSLPVFDRGYWYYSRTTKGKQYRTMCRRKGSMKAKEQVVLDLNVLAKGKPFLGIGGSQVSPNGKILAYSVDENGHRDYLLRLKNLDTNASIPTTIGRVSGFEWAQDNRTIYYTTENAAKRDYRLWRGAIGGSKSELLYEESDALFDLSIDSSRDHNLLFVQSESKDSSEARVLDLRSNNPALKLVAARRDDVRYYPDFHRGVLYLRSNDGAREFQVFSATLEHCDRGHWKPFLPEPKSGSLDSIDFFGDYAVLSTTSDASRKLEVLDLRTKARRPIPFNDSSYTAGLGDNRDPNANSIRVEYTSMRAPETILQIDLTTFKRTVLKKQEVIGYRPELYQTELVWATMRDGTKAPISILSKKGLKRSSNTPMLIDAYGAYGSSNFPQFFSSWVSLLDRGMMVALAHVRGGGEMGEKWYYAGKLAHKMNTFTDFIDCADALVKKGYTSHRRIAISGGSAGGLTMGAVLNLRPDVCRVALVYVPFVDVINTMSDESIPLTTQEFVEWGNPMVEEQYRWMIAYSPYEGIRKQNYPAILARTSLNDSQVPYWEPAKWVSRLRDLRTNKEPILFKTNMNAGHGGSSGRYDAMKDDAYDLAFMLTMLSIYR